MARRNGLRRWARLSLIALLGVRVLHRHLLLLSLMLLLLRLLLLRLLLLLHHGLLLALLLSDLHLLLREMRRQLNRSNLLLVVPEGLLILLLLEQLLQLLLIHTLQLLNGYSQSLSLLHHSLANHVLLLLLELRHQGRVAVGLKLLLLHELLCLLWSHMAHGMHATLCAGHVLRAHALTRHSHPGARVLSSHAVRTRLHASDSAGLHAHHGTRLANMRRPRHAGVHLHLLAHVLVGGRRHAGVAVRKTRMHVVTGRICCHHFAVARCVGRSVMRTWTRMRGRSV